MTTHPMLFYAKGIAFMIVSLEAYEINAYNRYAMCPAGQFRVNFWDL